MDRIPTKAQPAIYFFLLSLLSFALLLGSKAAYLNRRMSLFTYTDFRLKLKRNFRGERSGKECDEFFCVLDCFLVRMYK